MVNGFTDMIAGSLNLKEPWYVEGAEFLPEKQEIHIYVKVREDGAFACPVCGGTTVRNGYEPSERVWRHGDCMIQTIYGVSGKSGDGFGDDVVDFPSKAVVDHLFELGALVCTSS